MNKSISATALACIALSGAAVAGPEGGSPGNTGGYVLCKNGQMYGYYNVGSTNYGPDVSYGDTTIFPRGGDPKQAGFKMAPGSGMVELYGKKHNYVGHVTLLK